MWLEALLLDIWELQPWVMFSKSLLARGHSQSSGFWAKMKSLKLSKFSKSGREKQKLQIQERALELTQFLDPVESDAQAALASATTLRAPFGGSWPPQASSEVWSQRFWVFIWAHFWTF